MRGSLPIQALSSIGPAYAKKLKKLDIYSVEDLVSHFPFRYDDFSRIQEIQNLTPDQKLTVQGTIWQIKNIRTRTGKFVTTASVADQSGVIDVIWFNQPYLTKTIKAGMPISISGKIDNKTGKPKLISPQYELIRNQQPATSNQLPTSSLHTGRLVPIYPETEGLTSKWIRTKIAQILPLYLSELQEFLPDSTKKSQNLLDLKLALEKIHLPQNFDEVETSRKRLSFDELFLTQLLSQIRKKDWVEKQKAVAHKINLGLVKEFKVSLPFKLTKAQDRATEEVLNDLKKVVPMNRLLEGDVGSGKTVVASIAALISAKNGFDVLLAAPTEILTFQHYQTLQTLLKPFDVTVGIWTASKKGKGQITCGTHALLTSYKSQKQIGLVIVDEQHRFGVAQRAKLFMEHSKKFTPHLLTMTATPIPRTLALTMYGDLDLSVLDEMPLGRQRISTFVVPNRKRTDCYKFIEKEVNSGRQAFIITPFVEPSESMQTVKAATVEFEKLTNIFRHPEPTESRPKRSEGSHSRSKTTKHLKLGLLHGRLKSKEKEDVINKFKAGKIQILVATPVVEVGIDVPNASIIMVESADRFGLAQLHQLRGRVGRGEYKSYCFLFTDSNSENSIKRLKSMEKVHIGFELAEIDLKMRGSGEIFGLKQSGFINFKLADISDHVLVSSAQKEAKVILESDPSLNTCPELKSKVDYLQEEYSQPN